jgi:hypothetical protein
LRTNPPAAKHMNIIDDLGPRRFDWRLSSNLDGLERLVEADQHDVV